MLMLNANAHSVAYKFEISSFSSWVLGKWEYRIEYRCKMMHTKLSNESVDGTFYVSISIMLHFTHEKIKIYLCICEITIANNSLTVFALCLSDDDDDDDYEERERAESKYRNYKPESKWWVICHHRRSHSWLHHKNTKWFVEFSLLEPRTKYFDFFLNSRKSACPWAQHNITSHITSHPCLVISLNRDSIRVKESEQADRKRNIKLYGFLLRSNCQIMTMKSIFYTRDLSPFLFFFFFTSDDNKKLE